MAAKGGKQKEWKKLQDTLEQCKDDYEYDDQNDIAYYLEGKAYSKMYTINLDEQYLLKALASFNKAIQINPSKASYLVDRSKVYVELGQPENAVKDFQLISQLPQEKGIDGLYAKHVQKSLVKLESIKSTIDKLRANKELSDDFLQSYKELVNVAQGLVLKVGLHDQKIGTLTQENQQMKQRMKQIENKFNQLLEQVPKGQMSVKEMSKQIIQLRQRIISVQNSMTKYVSRDQFDQMAASMDQRIGDIENKVEFCNSKIVIIQGQVKQQKVKIAHIDESLRKSNIYKKNEVKDKFDNLRDNDYQLYQYANVFYWTFSNYILAYRVISTGLVKGQEEDSYVLSLAKKVTGIFSDTLSSIPGVGGLILLIEHGVSILYNGYKNEKLVRKIQKINKFVSKNALQEDINLGILIAAIEISIFREPIIKANPKNMAKISYHQNFLQARGWFQEKLDKIITQMTGIQKVYESKVSKAALADVMLLLGYLMTSDAIMVKNGQDCFHEEIVAQFKKGILEDQLIELKKNQNKKKQWKWPWSK